MTSTDTDIKLLDGLNDLDLGALAHHVGVTGENRNIRDAARCARLAICGALPSDADELLGDLICAAMASGTWTAEMAGHVAALGAKVRAALPAEPNHVLATVRVALGCAPHDDIVVHARKVKARAVENERLLSSLAEITATADRRLKLLQDADERDSRIRDALGGVDFESTVGAVLRIRNEHELDLKAAAFEIRHLRDERDEARARVDSLRRHNDPDRPPAP